MIRVLVEVFGAMHRRFVQVLVRCEAVMKVTLAKKATPAGANGMQLA